MADNDTNPPVSQEPEHFPKTFWTANLTELLERSAYYSVASFVVIYLGRMGLGEYWPSNLNSVLWGLVYFLPILSGTIADQVGFKRSLLVAFVMLAVGYFMMGVPLWFGSGELFADPIPKDVVASTDTIFFVVLSILLIGFGGSIIKPCVSGTIQKTAGSRATLAFALFYMVINIGSLIGRLVSYLFRTQFELSYIWAVAACFCGLTFFVVLFLYRDTDEIAVETEENKKPKKSIGRILKDMVAVLGNRRFSFFLIASSGFWFLYCQVYNVIPRYWNEVLETDPAADMYTIANPFVIVFFQLLITKLFGKMKPVRSIIIGNLIVGLAMLINLGPIWFSDSIRVEVWDWMPIATLIGITTVGLIAFGELFAAARAYEYIGAMAPKGQEGLFLGYANLPVAIGAILGGPLGALIFNEVMCKGATELPNGLLELDPTQNTIGWLILGGIGMASAILMWSFNIWLKRQIAKDDQAGQA
ncbi:MAG: MFS transporter [Deltaproteobacteria bacterium]|nr:MFS transporter [Deltaproteobacteria bacterium]